MTTKSCLDRGSRTICSAQSEIFAHSYHSGSESLSPVDIASWSGNAPPKEVLIKAGDGVTVEASTLTSGGNVAGSSPRHYATTQD